VFDEMKITPAVTLTALEYEVVDVCKYRTKCLLRLHEPGWVSDSREAPVWVDLAELSETAKAVLASFNPDAFTAAGKVGRCKSNPPNAPLIHP